MNYENLFILLIYVMTYGIINGRCKITMKHDKEYLFPMLRNNICRKENNTYLLCYEILMRI